MSDTPENTPAPVLGQHTEEICRNLLNMSDEEIAKLIKEEILDVA